MGLSIVYGVEWEYLVVDCLLLIFDIEVSFQEFCSVFNSMNEYQIYGEILMLPGFFPIVGVYYGIWIFFSLLLMLFVAWILAKVTYHKEREKLVKDIRKELEEWGRRMAEESVQEEKAAIDEPGKIIRDIKEAKEQVQKVVVVVKEEEKEYIRIDSKEKEIAFRCNYVKENPDFLPHLKAILPEVTPTEIMLCIMLKKNMSNRDMSESMGISIKSVFKLRYRLRRKLGFETGDSLESWVKNI